jgi:hypothetical protein
MINRIRTRMRQLQEQADLRRMLRHSPPTVRADLWAAADRYLSQPAASGLAGSKHHPAMRRASQLTGAGQVHRTV